MRIYTIKFKDKERPDINLMAYDVSVEYVNGDGGEPVAYNFKKEKRTVAIVPFSEVLAIFS